MREGIDFDYSGAISKSYRQISEPERLRSRCAAVGRPEGRHGVLSVPPYQNNYIVISKS